jgi:excisionase family DNA binding protein
MPEPESLSVAEVADRLAVSRALVYRQVRAGHLPAIRVGRSWRIDRRALEGMFSGGSATPCPSCHTAGGDHCRRH